MAVKKPAQSDRIGTLVRELETVAKRLRTDIRKRAAAAGILKQLESGASQLRKRAAAVAAQVEKYVHELRMDLERAPKPAKKTKAARKPARRRTAARAM